MLQVQMTKWVFLGSKTVDFGLDRDVIQVGYRDGSFKKIKIVVRGEALTCIDVLSILKMDRRGN